MENFNHTQIAMNPVSQLQLLPTYSDLISSKFPPALSILDCFEVNPKYMATILISHLKH